MYTVQGKSSKCLSPGILMTHRAILSVFTKFLGSAGMPRPLYPHGQSTLERKPQKKEVRTSHGVCLSCHFFFKGHGRQIRTGLCRQTEHSSSEFWMQPERSLRTQQAELRSMALLSLMRSCTCLSCRMHGENLAPRWIRAS